MAIPQARLLRLSRHLLQRGFGTTSSIRAHENPLGLPRNNAPPTMPRRSAGPPKPRAIPNVKSVIVVSSAKGGVGKSTVSVNLALSLAKNSLSNGRRARIGLLDLDIFGPSVPILMGLEGVGEPELSEKGALLPMTNHGLPCMSMGFLLPPSPDGTSSAAPVVWRGLMVMKAVQQLLFDVDWSNSSTTEGLDTLVIDMPPGTGDVALTLTQLVKIDGAVIVSTPQEVALADARKGVAMFEKTNTHVMGIVLNMSHFTSPDTGKQYPLFGSPAAFDKFAKDAQMPVLARLPLEPSISTGGDTGKPVVLQSPPAGEIGSESSSIFLDLGKVVWEKLSSKLM